MGIDPNVGAARRPVHTSIVTIHGREMRIARPADPDPAILPTSTPSISRHLRGGSITIVGCGIAIRIDNHY
jgi:hypothetical protein